MTGITGAFSSKEVAQAYHQAPDWTESYGGYKSDYLHIRLVCWEVMEGVHITHADGREETVTG